MRFIEADENLSLRGIALQEAIEEDIKNGLIPFWVSGWSWANLFGSDHSFIKSSLGLETIDGFGSFFLNLQN